MMSTKIADATSIGVHDRFYNEDQIIGGTRGYFHDEPESERVSASESNKPE
jgi:hypothetical protein